MFYWCLWSHKVPLVLLSRLKQKYCGWAAWPACRGNGPNCALNQTGFTCRTWTWPTLVPGKGGAYDLHRHMYQVDGAYGSGPSQRVHLARQIQRTQSLMFFLLFFSIMFRLIFSSPWVSVNAEPVQSCYLPSLTEKQPYSAEPVRCGCCARAVQQ